MSWLLEVWLAVLEGSITCWLLLGICFLWGVPEDVVGEIGLSVVALAKIGKGRNTGTVTSGQAV